ncbi:MAG: zinc-ribbon domain-containing protein [Methylocella sp.]
MPPHHRCPIMLRGSCGVKLFICQHCQRTLLFENTKCERCGHRRARRPREACRRSTPKTGRHGRDFGLSCGVSHAPRAVIRRRVPNS